MRERFVDQVCADLPDTQRDEPFGPGTVVWKVQGRMFAAYTEDGHGLSLRVASAVAASVLIAQGRATAPPSLLGDGWVMMAWETPPEDLRQRLEMSHALVGDPAQRG